MSELPVIQVEKFDQPSFIPDVQFRTSDQIGDLVKAIALARPNFDVVTKNATNPFYRKTYADITEAISATAIPLAEQGVVVFQGPGKVVDHEITVTTRVAHSSGQWIEITSSGPAEQKTDKGTKFDMQTVGIAITYLRRYSLMAILNLGAEDDDGNGLASKPEPVKPVFDKQRTQDAVKEAIKEGVIAKTSSPVPEQLVKQETESSSNPLPTPEERAGLFERIKALKLDGRTVKGFIKRETKKDYNEVPFKQFEALVQKMEKAEQDGRDTLEKLVSKE